MNITGFFSLLDWNNTINNYIGFNVPSWILFIFNLILFAVIIKLFYWLFKNVLKLFTQKTATNLDDEIIDAIEQPLLLILIAVFVITQASLITENERFLYWSAKISVTAIILSVTWFLYRLIGIIESQVLIPLAQKSASSFDDQLYPILRKALRVILVILAGFYLLNWLNIDITPLVAGVGISGIALAFAAQKILGDAFGGVSIFAGKPFLIKDSIKVAAGSGTVEEIGLSTTKIRTGDGTLLIVPNSKIASDTIENITDRKQRKESILLGLSYDTSVNKLKRAKEIVKEILDLQTKVAKDYNIYFDQFGNSTLDLRVIYMVNEPDFAKFVVIKDSVNMQIKERFEKEQIEFAYPTHTVYMKK